MSLSKPSVYTAIWLSMIQKKKKKGKERKVSHAGFHAVITHYRFFFQRCKYSSSSLSTSQTHSLPHKIAQDIFGASTSWIFVLPPADFRSLSSRGNDKKKRKKKKKTQSQQRSMSKLMFDLPELTYQLRDAEQLLSSPWASHVFWIICEQQYFPSSCGVTTLHHSPCYLMNDSVRWVQRCYKVLRIQVNMTWPTWAGWLNSADNRTGGCMRKVIIKVYLVGREGEGEFVML